MENNKFNDNNILDEIKDNSNEQKESRKVIITIITIIAIIIVLGFLMFTLKLKKPKRDLNKEEKIELNEQVVNLTIDNDLNFNVEIISTIDYENISSITFHVPKTEDNIELKNIVMDSYDTDIYTYEDDSNYYFKFIENEPENKNNKTYKISFSYKPNLLLDNTKFIFLDNLFDDYISKLKLSMTAPYEFLETVYYRFNTDMECITNMNTVTCEKDNIDSNEQIYITFTKKGDSI